MTAKTLAAFDDDQLAIATDLLSAKISTMIGRKMEEDDWDYVYCNSKLIPPSSWSNLSIDVNHNGLGVEHKMLRITKTGSILSECGTTKMHPAGTRSIRIPDELDPMKAMESILQQYCDLIESRSQDVMNNGDGKADMRTGWLLWKDTLDEFLYFEERMIKPLHSNYNAKWNITPARGARKSSKSLWIYEKSTGKKRYSVTTTAGAKIQPYFDVPTPSDPNLYHFKVQGVLLNGGLVKVWLTKSTAKYLELLLGTLETSKVSAAIIDFEPAKTADKEPSFSTPDEIAVPISITNEAYEILKTRYNYISDEYVMQQFAISLGSAGS